MLKKKNVFVAIISFLFCLSLFAGNVVMKNENVMQNSAYAENIAFPGNSQDDYSRWEGEINSKSDTWWYDADGTITLNGSTWSTPLYLPADYEFVINIIGENVIETTSDNAIVYSGSSLTFEGTGSLTLISASNVFSFNSVAVAHFSDLSVKSGGEDVNLSSPMTNITSLVIGEPPAAPVVEVTGENKETTYDGSQYNLSNMFTYDTSIVDVSYRIAEGSTGEGTVTGCMLTITKCGVFNIEISVAGTKLTKVLTVNRANLSVGTGEGQVQIVVNAFDLNDQEVPYKYSNGWDIGEFSYITASLINNVGNGEILDFSLYHYDYNGAGEMLYSGPIQDIPQNIDFPGGRYLIRVVINESNLYAATMVQKAFFVKGLVEYFIPQNNPSVGYNDLDNGVFNLSNLYQIENKYLDSIDSISYKITSDVLDEPLILNNPNFEITKIFDSENGDDYVVEVVINTKDDGLYASNKFIVNLNVKKSFVTGFDISFENKAYDGEPVDFEVIENIHYLEYLIEYYKDETLLDFEPVENGKYTAKITVTGNDVFKDTIIYRDFIIGQTEIEIIWCEDDFTYNGTDQKLTAYYINYEGEEVPLEVFTDIPFRNVQVEGVDYSYKAWVTFTTVDNRYVLPDETVNQKYYHMKPMQLQVEVLNRIKYYGTETVPTLDVSITSGKVFVADIEPALWTLSVAEEINSETPVGSYEIIATATNANPNYEVTFTNTAYLKVLNVITTSDMIGDWTYGETAKTPYAESVLGTVNFFYYKGEVQLAGVPSEPGEYRLIARVGENEQDENWYEKEETFYIYKIIVNIPGEDTNEYIFNGQLQSYRVMDADLANAALYTISNKEYRDAGIHQVSLTINDFDHYRWPNNEKTYYMNFEIKKKPVEKPAADSRVHKYNGNPITYALAVSEDYIISDNTTQTQIGRYRVTVSLVDTNNTIWADGTADNVVYDFVINQGKIDNPVITDADGNAINTKDVSIIDVSGNGLNPESILKVEVVKSGDEKINKTKNQLASVLSKYDKIFKVADIKLVQYGVSVQPENRITLKMLVPEELRNANFTLYHIHTNENGEEVVSEVEYSKVDKDGYITFQTDKLSSFAFVYEQSSLKTSIVIFSVLSGIMFMLLVAQVVFFILKKKSKAKILAAAAPVFFVKSEVAATIALGCVFGALVIANIVMLVFNILAYRAKKCEAKKDETKKVEVKKDETKKTQTKEKKKPAETKKA